jgi:hypothetical protein
MKHCLRGQLFKAADELFPSIDGVLRELERSTLHAVFLEWIEKLKQYNSTQASTRVNIMALPVNSIG